MRGGNAPVAVFAEWLRETKLQHNNGRTERGAPSINIIQQFPVFVNVFANSSCRQKMGVSPAVEVMDRLQQTRRLPAGKLALVGLVYNIVPLFPAILIFFFFSFGTVDENSVDASDRSYLIMDCTAGFPAINNLNRCRKLHKLYRGANCLTFCCSILALMYLL